MDSLDTNVLVRFYTNDDPVQSPRAAELLLHHGPFRVSVSVVLELFWALKGPCGLSRAQLSRVLGHLIDFKALDLQFHGEVAKAIAGFDDGLEFADALHLAMAADSAAFWTFDDKGFARKAAKLGLKPACKIPGGAT